MTMATMKLPLKMYILILLGVSVMLYQYSLSSAIAFNGAPLDGADVLYRGTQNESMGHEAIKSGARRLDVAMALPVTTTAESKLPMLYIITPTYTRPEQVAELTRLSHTLMLVPNLRWIVVEDATHKSPKVEAILAKSGLPYTHLIAPMPEEFKKKKKGPKPRGVSNRNKGLEWIRQNAKDGVLYFADDDNTYDLDIFEEMRHTRRVSMFPVGLITKLGVSSPVVRNGTFAGFYDGWIAGRKFPVDMAGFAVSVVFLHRRPNATMPYKPGYEEDGFLKSLRPFEPKEIELLADKCTKILVWHTQTKKNEPSQPVDTSKYNNTNILTLKTILV